MIEIENADIAIVLNGQSAKIRIKIIILKKSIFFKESEKHNLRTTSSRQESLFIV